ncbi:MAG: ABC transporter substrate-binding protein [Dehalococcoidia bacterium]
MKIKILFILVSILLIGCSSSDENKEKALLTLDWYPNANHAGIYLAIEEKIFEDNNIDFSVEPPADPATVLNLVASGESDFGLFYQPDLLLARDQGVPVVAIAGIVPKPLNSIMTLETSKLSRPKDLEGKKIGFPGIPWNESMLKTMMECDKADSSTLEISDVGWSLGQTLLTGKVDAVIGAYWTHESIVMSNQGYETNVMYPDEWCVPPYYELILVTSEKNLENNPKLVENFIISLSSGYSKAISDPQNSIDILVKYNEDSVDEEVDRAGVELLVPLWEDNDGVFGEINREKWLDFSIWMKDENLISDNLDIDKSFKDFSHLLR